jgi:hypothetical protein
MTTEQTFPRRRHVARAATVLGASVAAAIAINAAIAWAAVAWGAPAGYGPLSLPAQGLFTVAGIVVGWLCWRAISHRARDPRRLLLLLVPLVTVLSLVPDALLLIVPVIPGTNTPAVVALMLMHLVVVGCAVPAYVLAERLRRPAPSATDAAGAAPSRIRPATTVPTGR